MIEFSESVRVPATVVHVIAVVFGMGGALMSDLLFTFFSKDKKLNKTEVSTLTILRSVVSYGLLAIIISGVFIFLSDMDRYMSSAKFLAKMSILAVLILNGVVLNKYIWPHILNRNFFTLKRERNIRRLAFASGAVSVTSWLAVCALGTLKKVPMLYGEIMCIYLVILLVAISVALFIEKRELN